MKANDRKKAYAERLYIEDGWTAKSIAETVGVTETTVGAWVKKGRWKEERSELLAAPHRLKKIIINQMNLVASGEKSQINTDDLSKLSRALERLDQKVSIQLIITVFKEFDNWIAGSDIETGLLKEMLQLHKVFIKHRIDLET